jgi:hypothetical protein
MSMAQRDAGTNNARSTITVFFKFTPLLFIGAVVSVSSAYRG